MSFATRDVTIAELEPAMQIAAGFSMQGALKLFGARLGFKLGFVGTQLSMELHASPLKLFNKRIQVCPAPLHKMSDACHCPLANGCKHRCSESSTEMNC